MTTATVTTMARACLPEALLLLAAVGHPRVRMAPETFDALRAAYPDFKLPTPQDRPQRVQRAPSAPEPPSTWTTRADARGRRLRAAVGWLDLLEFWQAAPDLIAAARRRIRALERAQQADDAREFKLH